jgi:hypothetical protein
MRCLECIPRHPWVKVVVGCDADSWTAQNLVHPLVGTPPDFTLWSKKHLGSMRLCNLLAASVEDGLIPLCDDMELLPGALEKALEKFNQEFPDDDGVLGFHQEGLTSYAPTGLFLMGQKFLARYPGKQVFNTTYAHFGDVEIYELAHKLGKFKFGGKEVAVYHRHEEDGTHKESRKIKAIDAALRKDRRESGQIWGDHG